VGLPDRLLEPAWGYGVSERWGRGVESRNRWEQLAAAGGERRIGEVRDPVLADAAHLRERSSAL
jgi:hypothetical protein